MSQTFRNIVSALALPALLAGCEAADAFGPVAGGRLEEMPRPSISLAMTPVAVHGSDRLALAVGDSTQLQFAAAEEAMATAPVTTLAVQIKTYGSYMEVLVRSTEEFDATQLSDADLSLGIVGGARVPIAKRQDGSYVKVVTGGGYPSVYYFFSTAELNPGGPTPHFSSLLLVGQHADLGVVQGTVTGQPIPSAPEPTAWTSLAPELVSVSPEGLAVGVAAGNAILTYGSAAKKDSVYVDVTAPVVEPTLPPSTTPAPPVASVGDFVKYASAEVEAILGPQLVAGAASNPWAWFDTNTLAKGLEHGQAFPSDYTAVSGDVLLNLQYYDQGLAQYLNYYRTGDEQYLALARKVTDTWEDRLEYDRMKGWGTSPRNSSMGGMMLRALDGRPELWPFIESYVRGMFQMWVGARTSYPELYFGVRDGGYMTLYAAWLAQVHPDPAIRAEFKQKVVIAAKDYYVRLQSPDGGWYWKDETSATKHPSGVWEQPFMVGLLLEALIEVHQMTGDPQIAQAITRSVDHLWSGYRTTTVPETAGRGVGWRAVPYFMFNDGTYSGEEHLAGATATREGWDTNTIREGRQRNSLVIHAFGYAYHLTKDDKYRQQGDELFSATYGKGSGPGADDFYGLGDFRAKEYNQAYRSAGRYLAWRVQ